MSYQLYQLNNIKCIHSQTLPPLLKETYMCSITKGVFAQQIREQQVGEDEAVLAFDVMSWFTSIPEELTLHITCENCNRSLLNLSIQTSFVANIMQLLEFAIKNNYFTYKQERQKQVFSCTIGFPVSASIPYLVMQCIEERAVSTATHHPLWCCLYMDDSHTFLIKGRLCAGVPLSSELYPPERTVYYHNEIPLREAE